MSDITVNIFEEHGVHIVRAVIPGPPGGRGAIGLSAYEVAVANGFVGTEQQWLDSLSASFVYVHDEPSPSFTWTINHNLGFRPSVELITVGGQEFDGDISHPTVNQTVVTLAIATAGQARLF